MSGSKNGSRSHCEPGNAHDTDLDLLGTARGGRFPSCPNADLGRTMASRAVDRLLPAFERPCIRLGPPALYDVKITLHYVISSILLVFATLRSTLLFGRIALSSGL